MAEPPSWLDRTVYPFESNYIELDVGRMHYIDEGAGPAVLMLHGNPTWSFMYREVVRTLSEDYRCIAPDYLGFGLSDKPDDWTYRPWDHAETVDRLLAELNVDRFHLLVHDWGGPIGLSVALDRLDQLQTLTVTNSWMWSLVNRIDVWVFSILAGSRPGRYLIDEWDLFTDLLMKWGVADSQSLAESVHRHYRGPFDEAVSKRGICQFPPDLIDADDWLRELWDRRARIQSVPALVLWGMKDPAFGHEELATWIELFDDPRVRRYPEASHYLLEDERESVPDETRRFLAEHS